MDFVVVFGNYNISVVVVGMPPAKLVQFSYVNNAASFLSVARHDAEHLNLFTIVLRVKRIAFGQQLGDPTLSRNCVPRGDNLSPLPIGGHKGKFPGYYFLAQGYLLPVCCLADGGGVTPIDWLGTDR